MEEGTTRSPRLLKLNFFAEGGGMTVLDDYTFEIDTVKPSWSMPWDVATGMTSYMGTGVISEKYYEEYGEEQAGFTLAVGTGPWQSVEHETSGTWNGSRPCRTTGARPPTSRNWTTLKFPRKSQPAWPTSRPASWTSAKFNLESISRAWTGSCSDCKFMTFTIGGHACSSTSTRPTCTWTATTCPLPDGGPACLGYLPAPTLTPRTGYQARKVRQGDESLPLTGTCWWRPCCRERERTLAHLWMAGPDLRTPYLATWPTSSTNTEPRLVPAVAEPRPAIPMGLKLIMALTNRPYPGYY